MENLNEMEQLLDENDNVSPPYEAGIPVQPGEIGYGTFTFENFDAREVLIDGKPTGEIHIKPKIKTTMQAAVSLFAEALHGFTVGGVLSDGLKEALEYPVYAKPATEMTKEVAVTEISNILQSVDYYITQMRR